MEIQEPKVYIKHAWETREGFRYKQPVEYCNGVKLTFETIRDFEKIFNVPFSVAERESKAYNNAFNDSKYYSEFWENDEAKNKAFSKIYEFNLFGKNGTGSSTTPLFPFEIYMMNDGFEMVSFCEMNSINPGVKLFIYKKSKKKIGDHYVYEGKEVFSRFYKKNDLIVSLAFGITIGGKKTNFYFVTNKSNYTFQVDNDINNYKNAINGKLQSLELIEA